MWKRGVLPTSTADFDCRSGRVMQVRRHDHRQQDSHSGLDSPCCLVSLGPTACLLLQVVSLFGKQGHTSMMGVEMDLEWLMISLMRGTPSVIFMLATPAKWNVLSVICVPGSPML